VDFLQVALSDPAEADQTLAALRAGADPATQGRGTGLPSAVEGAEASVDGTFGPGFFDAVAALPQGQWAGPVLSGYGPHLVYLKALRTPPVPALEAVRDAAIAGWRQDQAKALREAQYTAAKARYEVRIADDTTAAAP
jgi:hypothetical protein